MTSFALTAPNIFTSCATIIDDLEQKAAYLQKLHPDLNPALFYEAIGAGLASRNETTPASARIAPGQQQWLSTVEYKRTVLVARGWHIQEKSNCPFSILHFQNNLMINKVFFIKLSKTKAYDKQFKSTEIGGSGSKY